MDILQLEAELRQKKDQAEEELQTKEKEIETLIFKHKTSIMDHIGKMPPEMAHSAMLKRHLSNRSKEILEMNKQLMAAQKTYTQKELELDMLQKKLIEMESKAT